MKRRKAETLLEIAVARVGFRRALTVTSFMLAWDIAKAMCESDEPGRHFGMERYIEYWKLARKTAYREQALFRECFPGEETPDRLMAIAKAHRVQVAALKWSLTS